ncbi:MAG: heavy-metal-associated domain-containing protein [Thermodesulfobacteriota bacterium]
MYNIKHHRIRFQDRPAKKTIVELEDELKRIKGVNKVNVDFEKGEVFVEYDLMKIFEMDIEKKMVEMGFVLDSCMGQRLKKGWIHFTEENERDNLKTKPTSCCSDPTEKHRADMKR